MKDMDYEMNDKFEAEETWEREEEIEPTITKNRFGVVKVKPYTNHYMLVFGDDEGNTYYSSDKYDQYSCSFRLIGMYVFYMLAEEGIFLFKEIYCDDFVLETNWITDDAFWYFIDVDEELNNKHAENGWKLIQIYGDI